jgi:hypothetical protein
MKRSILVLFIFAVFLFPACKSEKQDTSAPPPESQETASALQLLPSDATREAAFYLKSQTIDLSKAKVQWFINDKMVEGAASPQFKSAEIKKRDIIYAKALAGNQEVLSNRLEIRNIPPVIANIKINPSKPKANDILKAEVTANDRDGDNVTFSYEWTNNGEAAGNGETLEGPFKRGDKISLKITPYDEEDYGQTLVVNTIIYNASPKVTGGGAEKFENNVYVYQIYALDPDGDELVYSLTQAPEGMLIDPKGRIRWKASEKDSGRHAVSVKVSDGQGGDILYNFDVTIGFK